MGNSPSADAADAADGAGAAVAAGLGTPPSPPARGPGDEFVPVAGATPRHPAAAAALRNQKVVREASYAGAHDDMLESLRDLRREGSDSVQGRVETLDRSFLAQRLRQNELRNRGKSPRAAMYASAPPPTDPDENKLLIRSAAAFDPAGRTVAESKTAAEDIRALEGSGHVRETARRAGDEISYVQLSNTSAPIPLGMSTKRAAMRRTDRRDSKETPAAADDASLTGGPPRKAQLPLTTILRRQAGEDVSDGTPEWKLSLSQNQYLMLQRVSSLFCMEASAPLTQSDLDEISASQTLDMSLDSFHIIRERAETISPQMWELSKLTALGISGFRKLSVIPEDISRLTRLRSLSLSKNKQLTRLPDGIVALKNLTVLTLTHLSRITDLPANLGRLTLVRQLDLDMCHHLRALPSSIGDMRELRDLSLVGCRALVGLPPQIGKLRNLKYLSMSSCNNITTLPASFGNLSSLERLSMTACENLRHLPESFGQCDMLSELSLRLCTALETLPESINGLRSLIVLDLYECSALRRIPDLTGLDMLQEMDMFGCRQLQELPNMRLPRLWRIRSEACDAVTRFPDVLQLPSFKQWDASKMKSLCDVSSIVSVPSVEDLNFIGDVALRELPDLARLERLQKLEITSTGIRAMPSGLGMLTALTDLRFSNIPITELPEEMRLLGAIDRLTVSNCRNLREIAALPMEIEVFSILNCPVVALPEIGSLNGTLWRLQIEECNALTSLPEDPPESLVSLSVVRCRAIKRVQPAYLNHTYTKDKFNFRSCGLSQLPTEVRLLRFAEHSKAHGVARPDGSKLASIFSGNPIISPPPAALRDNSLLDAYFAVCDEHEPETSQLLKVVLLGEGMAGKTSLLRALKSGAADPTAARDRTIFLDEATLYLRTATGEVYAPDARRGRSVVSSDDVQLTVWDFGGQDDYLPTQNAFMGESALYIFVLPAVHTVNDEPQSLIPDSVLEASAAGLDADEDSMPKQMPQLLDRAFRHLRLLLATAGSAVILPCLSKVDLLPINLEGTAAERATQRRLAVQQRLDYLQREVERIARKSSGFTVLGPALSVAAGSTDPIRFQQTMLAFKNAIASAATQYAHLFPTLGMRIDKPIAEVLDLFGEIRRHRSWETAEEILQLATERSPPDWNPKLVKAIVKSAATVAQARGELIVSSGIYYLKPSFLMELMKPLLEHDIDLADKHGALIDRVGAYNASAPEARRVPPSDVEKLIGGVASPAMVNFRWAHLQLSDEVTTRMLKTLLHFGVAFPDMSTSNWIIPSRLPHGCPSELVAEQWEPRRSSAARVRNFELRYTFPQQSMPPGVLLGVLSGCFGLARSSIAWGSGALLQSRAFPPFQMLVQAQGPVLHISVRTDQRGASKFRCLKALMEARLVVANVLESFSGFTPRGCGSVREELVCYRCLEAGTPSMSTYEEAWCQERVCKRRDATVSFYATPYEQHLEEERLVAALRRGEGSEIYAGDAVLAASAAADLSALAEYEEFATRLAKQRMILCFRNAIKVWEEDTSYFEVDGQARQQMLADMAGLHLSTSKDAWRLAGWRDVVPSDVDVDGPVDANAAVHVEVDVDVTAMDGAQLRKALRGVVALHAAVAHTDIMNLIRDVIDAEILKTPGVLTVEYAAPKSLYTMYEKVALRNKPCDDTLRMSVLLKADAKIAHCMDGICGALGALRRRLAEEGVDQAEHFPIVIEEDWKSGKNVARFPTTKIYAQVASVQDGAVVPLVVEVQVNTAEIFFLKQVYHAEHLSYRKRRFVDAMKKAAAARGGPEEALAFLAQLRRVYESHAAEFGIDEPLPPLVVPEEQLIVDLQRADSVDAEQREASMRSVDPGFARLGSGMSSTMSDSEQHGSSMRSAERSVVRVGSGMSSLSEDGGAASALAS